jgi:hypothetical protein
MPQKAPQKAPKPFDWAWIDWAAVRATFAASEPIVLMIGYGNAGAAERLDSPAVLRGIAQGFGATLIADCRAQPGGARIRQGWTQSLVKEALAGGPAYEWKGDMLGGKDRFRGRGCTADGLKWLDNAAAKSTLMCLCACSDRGFCHLHRIVATDLQRVDKRAEMGLAGTGPRFVHLHLDGSWTGGGTMLEATDEGLTYPAETLPVLAEYREKADKWRAIYTEGEPMMPDE